MNRQTKRQMQRQGGERPRAPERRAPVATQARERTTPRQFMNEVTGEMRKVAWPDREEILNSTIVVIIAVVVMTALIFGFDYISAKFVLFLFD